MIFPANIGMTRPAQVAATESVGKLGVGKYMEHSRNRLKSISAHRSAKRKHNAGRNHLSYGIVYAHENFRRPHKEWEME